MSEYTTVRKRAEDLTIGDVERDATAWSAAVKRLIALDIELIEAAAEAPEAEARAALEAVQRDIAMIRASYARWDALRAAINATLAGRRAEELMQRITLRDLVKVQARAGAASIAGVRWSDLHDYLDEIDAARAAKRGRKPGPADADAIREALAYYERNKETKTLEAVADMFFLSASTLKRWRKRFNA